jgi:hypothetical protein
MKKIIGLDIDEVFRAYIETFHYFYEKEFNLLKYNSFGEKINGYDCDFHTNKLNELFEFKDSVKKTSVMVSDIDVVYSSHQRFENEEMMISKDMALNIFKYEDYLMELYGTCPKTYTHVGLDLARLVEQYQDEYIFKFIVKDKTVTIGPTLFFLSTLKSPIRDYHFVNKFEDVWNLCNIYITANPDFVGNKPEESEIIMVNMPYNNNIEIEKRIDKLSDLLEYKML